VNGRVAAYDLDLALAVTHPDRVEVELCRPAWDEDQVGCLGCLY